MFKSDNFTKAERVDLTEEMGIVSPTDTPFVSLLMSRGLVDKGNSTIVSWIEKELDDGDCIISEGSDEVKGVNSKRVEKSNVMTIFAKNTAVSGTAQAMTGATIGDLLADEVEDRLKEIKVALEKTVLQSELNDGSNSSPRKMNGLSNFATKENTVSSASLTETQFKNTVKKLWDNGLGTNDFVAIVNADLKEDIDKIYKDSSHYQATETEFGLVVDTVVTNYGRVHILLNRHMPEDEMLIVDLDYIRLTFLREPFFESLGKTGDSHKGIVGTEATIKVLNEKAVAKFVKGASK